MKDYVLELAAKQDGLNAKMNVMREYLQAYTLRIMQDEGLFHTTAFLGGTALRFLHDLPRYSEDIDFSTVKGKKHDFAALVKKIKEELVLAGYSVAVTYKDEKIVQSAFVKFDGLLKDAGLSPFKEQNISLKIEIDTNPPDGAIFRTDIVNKYFPISFLSYDLPSLFAGKSHALLSRGYTKGRDFFDLGWYLSKWKDLKPNIALLNNALTQTGWKQDYPTENTWRNIIGGAVNKADWGEVKKDVGNFLERPEDLSVFTKENVLKMLERA
ncbi:MAG: nucleotidyl transferase AbiEii/AbiGii toxin family protein [Candidatus Omnitrophica bacterium]|nr:nucleotidyl transferase AbiEii/AbiGii toxin family protein [Candidatus Omnitrophota bacterium]MBU4487954.1 nucleotidyl transferase AbiEii/AbiGii toxin family protein [Candidatus Omnitrophota bacterium]MCG2704549.1 nucleotidyl transferase AbiEii/AbiGii toxin family protein [Candidatus Omnitrophota bacterium]